jgi:hypothetical protein
MVCISQYLFISPSLLVLCTKLLNTAAPISEEEENLKEMSVWVKALFKYDNETLLHCK